MSPFVYYSNPGFNFVGKLNEWAQRRTRTTFSESYYSIGLDHQKIWYCTLTVTTPSGCTSFEGDGDTKKEAKNFAASQACVALGLIRNAN
ncbi:hypothetical protein JCM5350_002590 [Sporobolomyces pararoseus]